jgi:hypothetical protein
VLIYSAIIAFHFGVKPLKINVHIAKESLIKYLEKMKTGKLLKSIFLIRDKVWLMTKT